MYGQTTLKHNLRSHKDTIIGPGLKSKHVTSGLAVFSTAKPEY